MPDSALTPKSLLGYTDEGGDYEHVRKTALELAMKHHARLVYYDGTSASNFSEPVVSRWSSDREGSQVNDPMTPDQLEVLGRHPVAEQVKAARDGGVDAWGWLASEHGIEPMLRYAADHDTDLVLVPDSLADDIEDAEDVPPVPVAVVHDDGAVELK